MKTLNASILLIVLAFAGGLSGCNTTAGVGQDIEAAGGAIEGAAEDASN
jgi:predicted small secreted protein